MAKRNWWTCKRKIIRHANYLAEVVYFFYHQEAPSHCRTRKHHYVNRKWHVSLLSWKINHFLEDSWFLKYQYSSYAHTSLINFSLSSLIYVCKDTWKTVRRLSFVFACLEDSYFLKGKWSLVWEQHTELQNVLLFVVPRRRSLSCTELYRGFAKSHINSSIMEFFVCLFFVGMVKSVVVCLKQIIY